MIIKISFVTNLGDFLNSLPVLSGIQKSYGKIILILNNDLKKFKGIKEFLMYQDIFSCVFFQDEFPLPSSAVKEMCCWLNFDFQGNKRPDETFRYELWMKYFHKLNFNVDDDFVLKVEDLNLPVQQEKPYGGDRWSGPNIDVRRSSWVLGHLDNIHFLDYNDSLMQNAYYIKHSNKPFLSTFTGISILADLLNKEHYVIWTDELRTWDNKPIQDSYKKHYYLNRKSKLIYLGDFEKNVL